MSFNITTPLYYVNDNPHLGSTYTTIACDSIARYKRLLGEEVIFVTGVDEHGQKILRTANSLSIEPQVHCDNISANYQSLWKSWGISHDRFVRTTSKIHNKYVRYFFDKVRKKGDIYIGRQKGWYCVGCEEYKECNDSDEKICPIHLKPLEMRDEENLFFRLSKYQHIIEELLENESFISPKIRQNEIIQFAKRGLKDFSISRVNLSWGISVPGYTGHTFYVWFDALLGYVSSLYNSLEDINEDNLVPPEWPASIHIIGKDILRFHAIYWPAMLMSAELPLPKKVFGHGFLTREGNKMGKSLGNVLDPKTLLLEYGSDRIRWFLLKDIQFGNDGDFQHKRFIELTNNDLANTIGNLLNRTISMSHKWFGESIPDYKNDIKFDNILRNICNTQIEKYTFSMNNLDFQTACNSIMEISTNTNLYLSEFAPWIKIKTPERTDEVKNCIYSVLETTRIIGLLLAPLLPDLSSKIISQLNCNESQSNWTQQLKWGQLKSGKKLPLPEPIISKLER